MNEKTLKILEFNKIIDKLVSLATSSLGKELAEKLCQILILTGLKGHKRKPVTPSLLLQEGNPAMGEFMIYGTV